MPRTEVYQLRLTKSEKDELARRAEVQGVSIAKLIRQRLKLDAKPEATPAPDTTRYIEPPPISDEQLLIAKHKLRHPTATAERMARKELES
jgi:hypothetical protein